MVFMPDRIDESFLDACPRLRVVAAALKGYDNFDIEACRRRKIRFTIVPDLLTVPTAELAIALMLGLSRRIIEGDRQIRHGAFQGWRPTLYGVGAAGSTAGIIGMGQVGKALAVRLRAFAMTVLYMDQRPLPPEEEQRLGASFAPLPELLAKSDFLFPFVPLTNQTLHLLGSQTLAATKRGAFLINCSRGSVVDEKAVAQALAEGQLAGYAADVFEMEEWSRPDRPRCIWPALLADEQRTLFTPHLGSAVAEVRREIEMAAARELRAAFAGEPSSNALT